MRIPSDFFPSYSNGSASSTTVILLSISAVILAVYCIVGFIKSKKTTPRQTRLPGPRRIPIFGNFLSIARTSLQLYHKDLTDKFGKTCMYYEGATPVILTKDLNLIRIVFIKDFSTSFVDRHSLIMFVNDPIDKFLLLIKGDDWKVMRKIMESKLSLDKIKQMSNKMLNCIRNYEDNLKDIIDKKKGIIQTQKFYSSYVMDVSSSCFYGLDINSIKEPNNKVLKNVENIFKQGLLQKLKLFLLFLAPNFTSNLVKSNKLDIAPMDAANYLIDLANKIIAERKVSPEAKRYDFMDNMIELGEDSTLVSIEDGEEVKEVKKTLSNSEIVAQAILFLAAGYINPHLALEFISYNLAKHPAVQETLIKEIDSVLEKHNQISYDSIQDMKYMDMVIMETLRMYPPTIKLDRTATKDCVYEGITIKKGQQITVPIHAMHHDAGIYPNPEEFKPERFTEENKAARDSLTFLAFGAGARNCIGVKFALSVIKLFLTSILIKYKFRTCDKTPETIVLDKSGSTRSEKPIFVQLEKRTLLYTI